MPRGALSRLLDALLSPAGIAAVYFVLSISWILFSDDLVAAVPDRHLADLAQSIKGMVFVGGTSLLLLALIGRHRREITRQLTARGQERQVRDHLTAALAHLSPGPTPEATAAAICSAVRRLPGIDLAALVAFEPDGAVSLAIDSSVPPLQPVGSRVAPDVESELLHRSREDAWVEEGADSDGALAGRVGTGLLGLIGVPIRDGRELQGVLLAGTAKLSTLRVAAQQLPSAVELAGVAEVLIIPSLRERRAVQRRRKILSSITEDRAFSIVFQPIVDLSTGRTAGFEALTRFDDGSSPSDRFAEAAEMGLSVELETACLVAAVAAAKVLPRRAWLSLNVSPGLLVDSRLPPVLQGVDRSIVLELTEREPVTNYPAVRAALATIGRTARLAVDDAGAGFASLRHLAELRPAMVKIDRDLIAGLGTDRARQAIIAGLSHYADCSRCILIAEGVETEAEKRMLQQLGVKLGQGYLLGPPAPTGFTRGATGREGSRRAPLFAANA